MPKVKMENCSFNSPEMNMLRRAGAKMFAGVDVPVLKKQLTSIKNNTDESEAQRNIATFILDKLAGREDSSSTFRYDAGAKPAKKSSKKKTTTKSKAKASGKKTSRRSSKAKEKPSTSKRTRRSKK